MRPEQSQIPTARLNLRRRFSLITQHSVRCATGVTALFLLVLLAACMPDPSAGQTAEAVNATLGTRAALRRLTATFEADRRVVTQIALENAATLAKSRQERIISTLEELGVGRPDLLLITPAALPTNPAFAVATSTPEMLDTGGITRAAPTVDPALSLTPPTPLPAPETPTPDPTLPRVENLVMSTGVGEDDCSNGTTASFTTTSPQIYVVMNAYNLAAGMTVTARWSRDGTELTIFDFAPDFDINGPCIWFYAEPVDFAFDPGAYRVEIAINGTPAAATDFSIQ